MRVTYKLTVILLLCVAGVLALYGWLSVRREARLIEGDALHDARVYGEFLSQLVAQMWKDHGPEATAALLERVNATQEDVQVRLLTEDLSPAARGVLRDGEVTLRLDRDAGTVLTHLPLAPGAVLEVQERLVHEEAYLRDSVQRVVLTSIATAALFGVIAIVVGARFVGRPMHELVMMARRVGDGDLTRRLSLGQRDEIGDLAREMNLMCDHLALARAQLERETAARIDAIERLRHADRLSTVGRLAAGMAHELGTPLSVIQGHADLLADGALSAEETAESARVIGHLTRRMAGTIRQTLDFARLQPAVKDVYDVHRLCRRVLDMLEELARRTAVRLHLEGEPVMALVDGYQLEQVVTNLVVNSVQATPDGGDVRVSVRRERRHPPPRSPRASDGVLDVVSVTVADRGVGIPPDHVAQLWEPFFTTKAVGQGTGLGLPIVQGIVEDHGGWIEVQSQVGAGSTFTVCLPRGVEE
ncbi:MAG: HAMP domain-containing histidine kinase [Planctomycetes bacterium]|nr:HAMP domain-containing histidine kinase [Planctomycetota bacterium]